MPNKEKVRRELTLPDSTDNVKAMVIKTVVLVHIKTTRIMKQNRVQTGLI